MRHAWQGHFFENALADCLELVVCESSQMLLFLHLLEYGGQNAFIQTVIRNKTKKICRICGMCDSDYGDDKSWLSQVGESWGSLQQQREVQQLTQILRFRLIQKQKSTHTDLFEIESNNRIQSTHINCRVSTYRASSLVELLSQKEHVKNSYVILWYMIQDPFSKHLFFSSMNASLKP